MARAKTVAYEFPRPAVTVDMVVFGLIDERLRILLIRRRHEPFRGRWALPGGFVDPDETLEQAARRELLEETGVATGEIRPVAMFGDPGRDPRGWTISAVYYALAPMGAFTVVSGDDADEADWKPATRLPSLAFDHRKVIDTALGRLRTDLYVLPVAKPAAPSTFTLREIAALYAALDSSAPAGAVLRRRLVDANVIRKTRASKPCRYRFRRTLD